MVDEQCECDSCVVLRDIGHAIGCDHTDDPDGRQAMVRCVRESVDDKGQQYDVDDVLMWRPLGGIQKVTLRYVPKKIQRTVWLFFFTRWFAVGFVFGGMKQTGKMVGRE